MFITSTTLALLAAIGLYAIAAATTEAKVSGYVRQSTQAHYMSEQSIGAAAGYMAPQVAGIVVHDYMLNPNAQTKTCVTAAKYTGSGALQEACYRAQVSAPNANANPALTTGPVSDMGATAWVGGTLPGALVTGSSAITEQSFVEFTYPHAQTVPGTGGGGPNLHYYRVTATTFGVVQSGEISKMEFGRGHLIVGPYQD